MLGCRRMFFSQPGTKSLAPGWPILIDAKFLRHRFACLSEKRSGSFVPNLSQRGQVAAHGEDYGSSTWEAGKSVMFGSKKGNQGIEFDGCRWTVG